LLNCVSLITCIITIFLNSFQSAYIKYHSTETTLLSVHDHLIKAISLQQVTCLTLLELSAAFDTVDHSVLLERLSAWFGITSVALSWIKIYLLNRSFYVNVENTKSSLFQLLYGVPQGSVLGPLLFILYTTLLSTVMSNSSANHHLYAGERNISCHSLLQTLHKISLFLNLLYVMSTTGCHLTFFLLVPLRLSLFLLVFLNNSQTSAVLALIYLIMSLCHLFILLVI
jgi:Reverse transcriptase (RNA-dependent DNA polymerase)